MKKWISLLMCVILTMTPVLVAADTGPGPVSGVEAAPDSGNGTDSGEEGIEPAGASEETAPEGASEETAPEGASAAAPEAGAEAGAAAPEAADAEAALPQEPQRTGFFGAIGKAVDYVSEKVGNAGKATKEAIEAGGHAISGAVSGIAERTGNAISKIREMTDQMRQNAENTANRISKATSSLSQDIGEKTASTAEEAMGALHEAADTVTEGAGKAVNNAVESAGEAADAAVEGVHSVVHAILQALSVVTFKGAELISKVDEAVQGLDLSDPENYERVREAVDKAVMAAYDHGIIGKSVSRDALRIIEELAFASTVYGYQYAHHQITLRQYIIKILRIVLKSELPTAVGLLANRLPIPGAGEFAKELTVFLIQTLLGEKYEAGRPITTPTPTPTPLPAGA